MKRMYRMPFVVASVIAIVAMLMIGCSEDDDNPVNNNISTATVSGTLTLPSPAVGKVYVVIIDTDTNGDDGGVAYASGTCGSGSTVNYSTSNVPTGTYYVYAVVFVGGNPDGPPGTGDYLGFYATGPIAPGQPNATVPASGTVTFNITLSVIG